MSRGAAWTVHLSVIGAGATGVVYGWLRYFGAEDEFGGRPPLEDEWQALHVLLVPALVFACGLLWRTHVWGRLRANYQPRRNSGRVLAYALLPMVASGYLLLVSGGVWREIWVWLHGITSTLWLVTYGLHQFASRDES